MFNAPSLPARIAASLALLAVFTACGAAPDPETTSAADPVTVAATPAGKPVPELRTHITSAEARAQLLACPARKVCGDGCVDPGEECDGGPCCTSTCQLAPPTQDCISDAGACVLPTKCDHRSPLCPVVLKPKDSVCRSAAGGCDKAEVCDGITPTCPTDEKQPKRTLCRAATAACDAPEYCDGTSADCPPDLGTVMPCGTGCHMDDPRKMCGFCDGKSGTCGQVRPICVGQICPRAIPIIHAVPICVSLHMVCPYSAGASVADDDKMMEP